MYGSRPVVHRFPNHRAPKRGIDIRRRKKVILSNRRKQDRADKKFVAGLLKRSTFDDNSACHLYRLLYQHAKHRFELGLKLDLIRRLAGQLERGKLTAIDLQAELFPPKRRNPDRRAA
jgi:hypothetical protein